jgi:hypothetical protein
MANWQIVVADASGNSAILEGDSTIPRQGDWQVCTNFLQSATAKPFTDARYLIVANELAKENPISMASFAASCNAAHQSGSWATVYTSVTNLKTRDIDLYVRSDYSQHVTFNLGTELAKGAHRLLVRAFYKTFQAVDVRRSANASAARSHSSTVALRFGSGANHLPGIVVLSKDNFYDVKGCMQSRLR